MASEAQILANRANAQKSTGPRTAEGKAVVSQNAVTHGFLARETVIQGEDAGEFTFYRDRKLRDLGPVGDEETEMAERIVDLAWRLRRAERLQTEAFDALYEKMATGPAAGGMLPECVPEAAGGAGSGDDRLLGRMLVEDFSNARVLERLLLYERRIENSLYRTQRELREQKRMRLAGALVEPMGAGRARSSSNRSLLSALHEHGQDAHATMMPAGVTTDLLPAQGSLFKTKPICEGIGVQGSGISNLIPDTRPLTPEASRKTNPICAGTGEIAVFEAEKGGSVSAPGDSVETKPISRGDSSAPAAVRRVA